MVTMPKQYWKELIDVIYSDNTTIWRNTNYDKNSTQTWDIFATQEQFPEPDKQIHEITYRNGRRLKVGEVRPDPHYVRWVEKFLPIYNYFTQYEIFRIMFFGAYSRKYGKPRRKRKKKIF